MQKTTLSISERQLDRLIQSKWDFQQALSALTFLLEECDYEGTSSVIEMRKYRCYETTLVVSMMRPFIQSRGETILNRGIVGYKFSKEEENLFEKVKDARNKVLAHSDNEEMHFKTVNLDIGPDDFDFTFPHIVYDEGLFFKESEIRVLENLLRYLRHHIYNVLTEYSQANPEKFEKYKQPASMIKQEK